MSPFIEVAALALRITIGFHSHRSNLPPSFPGHVTASDERSFSLFDFLFRLDTLSAAMLSVRARSRGYFITGSPYPPAIGVKGIDDRGRFLSFRSFGTLTSEFHGAM